MCGARRKICWCGSMEKGLVATPCPLVWLHGERVSRISVGSPCVCVHTGIDFSSEATCVMARETSETTVSWVLRGRRQAKMDGYMSFSLKGPIATVIWAAVAREEPDLTLRRLRNTSEDIEDGESRSVAYPRHIRQTPSASGELFFTWQESCSRRCSPTWKTVPWRAARGRRCRLASS